MGILLEHYQVKINAGSISRDAAQDRLAHKLDALAQRLPQIRRRRFLFWGHRSKKRGLYIHGAVGRGKSMLMDLFFESVHGMPKRRVHFHAFMLEVQARLHEARTQSKTLTDVAQAIAKEAHLLCFDEFQVYNIADAMILSRLFRQLFRAGVVVVATSNAAPDDLYKDGLQRILFLPFIDLIKKRLDIVALDDGHDYRQDRLRGKPIYLTPPDNGHEKLQALFSELTDDADGTPLVLKVQGRSIDVPRAARGVAWFSYGELCQRPLGAADFLTLTENFHTLIIENIPLMHEDRRDETMRFINLIDVLYDQRCKLIASAAARPAQLISDHHSLKNLFARTASRLEEMQAQDYGKGR